jgi:carbon-monoxide dehydrogenase iron sulfur subunit
MKVLSFSPELCVGCHICEEVCSDTWFKTTDAAKSSIRILDDGGEHLRAVFCVQCGECIDVCPTKAISRDRNGIVRIQKKLCVGCLSCVGFCPYLAMFYHPDQTEPFKCIACGKCVKECPADALEIVEAETPALSVTEQWAARV